MISIGSLVYQGMGMHTEKRSQWMLPVILGAIVVVTGLGFYLLQQAEQASRKQQAIQQLKVSNELVADWISEQRRLVGVWAHFPQVVEYAKELNQLPANRTDLVKQPAQVALRDFFSPLMKASQIDGYAIIGRLGYVRASQRNSLLGLKSPIAEFPSVFAPLWKGRTQWLLPYNNPEPSRTEHGVYESGQPQLLIASPIISGHGMQAVLAFSINTQRQLNQLLRNVLHDDVQALQVFSRDQLVMSFGEWQPPVADQITADWAGSRFPLEFKMLYKARPISQQLSVMHWVMLITGSMALTGLILLSLFKVRRQQLVIDGNLVSELVYEQSTRGLFLLDETGKILSYNTKGVIMLAGSDPVGKGEMHTLLLEFILTLQTEQGEAAPEFARLLNGKHSDQVYVGQWGGGQGQRWLSCRMQVRQAPVPSVLVELDDVTERRELEVQLQCRSRALDQAAELVLWVNMDGQVVYANETALSELEYDLDMLKALRLQDVDTSLSVDGWNLLWDRVRRGERVQLESRLMKRSGQSFPAETHMNFYQDGFNSFVCMFSRDISTRKQLETELHRNSIQLADKLSVTSQELVVREAENDALMESLPDLLLVLNARFEVVNFQQPKSGALLPSMQDGQSLFTIFPTLDAKPLQKVFLNAEFEADGRYFCEVTQKEQYGNQILELRFAQTSAKKIMVLVRDITERKKQEFIQQFNNRLLTYISTMQTRFICNRDKRPDLIAQLHDLMALTQAEYGFYLVTDELKARLECPEWQEVGLSKLVPGLEGYPAKLQSLAQEYLAQWYTHERSLVAEFVECNELFSDNTHPMGSDAAPGVMLLPILAADEVQMMFAVVVADRHGWSSDIALLEPWIATCATILAGYDNDQERLWAEQKLQEEKHRVEQASKAKTQFLSRMSHEFRTPLNAILGFGQLMMMEEEGLNAEQLLHIEQIVQSGSDMLDLVDEILDLAQLESQQISVDLSQLELAPVLKHCADQKRHQIDTKNLRLDVNLSSEVVNVQGNEKRLVQVINNLLENAIEYTPEEGVVTISLEKRQGYGIFKVTDTGSGIDSEFLEKLFLPFEAGEGANSKGIGNGLALTRHLVEAMQGSIDVESEIGVGSCFTVALPLSDREAQTAGQALCIRDDQIAEDADEKIVNESVQNAYMGSTFSGVFARGGAVEGVAETNQDKINEIDGPDSEAGGHLAGFNAADGIDATNVIAFPGQHLDTGEGTGQEKGGDAGAASTTPVAAVFDLIYIEDDAVSRRMLQQILKKYSDRIGLVNVRSAEDAEGGISLFLDQSPDLLLVDMNLQGLSGSEVLSVIRSQPEGQEVPIVALSGHVEQTFIDQAFEQGFDDYLCKPLDVELLISVIERYRS